MLKKIWTIFIRDLKVNSRDFLSIYLLVFPVLFALGINALTPSINDTTVNLALIENDNQKQVNYLKDYAKVELFKDADSIKNRVENRDNIIGILPEGDAYYILTQGNEPEDIVSYAKILKTFYEQDVQISDSNAEIFDFGKTVSPLKEILVNITILFASLLGGMLIAINIVEEKIDNTVSAINISPVSRNAFILGKSLMGLILPIYGTIAVLLITGFGDVNIGQTLLIILASSIVSILVGFIEGINNDDVMNAAGNFKMIFLPVAAAIVAIEMLADKWQIFFYWIPFYWTYKGTDAILEQSAGWGQILLYTGIVLGISGIVYLLLMPKIRKGLE